MNFLHHTALWGLLALLIPIIIHLFKFRRVKRIQFSTTNFLKQVKEQNKAKQQIKRWLILVSRLAFILFVVLTFAQPYFSKDENYSYAPYVQLYLDNSQSLSNEVEEGLRGLDAASIIASSIINIYPRGTKFQLLTSDFSADQNYFYSAEIVRDKLTELDYSSSSRKIADVFSRWKNDNALTEGRVDRYYISDFQENSLMSEVKSAVSADSLSSNTFVTVPFGNSSNLYIDSIYLSQPFILPGQANTLHYRIVNAGNTSISTQVKISLNNTLLATQTLEVKAAASVVGSVSIQQSISQVSKGKIEITDFPVTYDNTAFFVLNPAPAIKVLILSQNEASNMLRSVYSNPKLFRVKETSIQNLNFSNLNWADLIIIEGLTQIPGAISKQIADLKRANKSVLFIPSGDGQTSLQALGVNVKFTSAQDLQRLKKPDYSNLFFKGIFAEQKEFTMPEARTLFQLPKGMSPVYSQQSGQVFFGRDDNFWLFASPLTDEYTNFHRHALFLPTLYKVAFSSITTENPLYYSTEAKSLVWKSETGEGTITLNNNEEYIPIQQQYANRTLLSLSSEYLKAGYFNLIQNDSIKDVLAFNLPNTESELDFASADELQNQFADVPNVAVKSYSDFNSETKLQANLGSTFLWKWTLLLALLCLMFEALLIRFWK